MKEDIGKIEWLLKTRKYTEKERNNIIDLTNKIHNLIYNKADKKFRRQWSVHQYGLTLSKGYDTVVQLHEESDYAM